MFVSHKITENVGLSENRIPLYQSIDLSSCSFLDFHLGPRYLALSTQSHHDESHSDVVGQHQAEAHKLCEGMQGREQHQNAAKPGTRR